MEEGVSAIVTAQSTPDGALSIVLHVAEDAAAIRLERAVLALTVRLLDAQIVRVSLANPATGSVAYFQSALPALALARELGLQLVR